MTKLYLADNQILSATGLKFILSEVGELEIYEAPDYFLLKKIIKENPIGILAIDYQYFKGFDVHQIKNFQQEFPLIKILIITSDDDKERIYSVISNGVTGFITKECCKEEIILAINAIRKGQKFFCNKIYDILMEKRQPIRAPIINIPLLTLREKEILKLIVEGHSTQKIADKLFLSYHTINSHRKSICKKLKIKSPTELVIYAIDHGILEMKI